MTYYGFWDDRESMMHEFQIEEDKLEGVDILFAIYDGGGYDGDVFVVFEKGGDLFEVGGHCSCYGLEGQWEPEKADPEILKERIEASNENSYYKIIYQNKDIILDTLKPYLE